MKSVSLRFVASLALCAALLRVSLASTGTEGAAFLNIPVGAGPAAMGSAYSALAEDAYAPVFNPGGLGRLSSTQISGQHLAYLEGSNYEFVSLVHPLNSQSGVGFSMQYLGSGDIDKTGPSNEALGEYSAHFASYALAYGRALTDRLSLGLTGKLIEAKLDDVSAHAWAGDAGLLFRAHAKATLAATVTNVGSDLKFLQGGDSLPLAFRLGAALRPAHAWTVSADGVYRRNGLASFHVGGRWQPLEMLSLRTGYRTDTVKGLSALAGFSTGIGVDLWGQELAYAWLPYGDLGSTQYFSLLLRFAHASDEKRNLIHYRSIRTHGTAQKAPAEPELEQLLQRLPESDARMASGTPEEDQR
jgi:hypothetical protein